MELLSKVKMLERETELMRKSDNIVESVTSSNKEFTKLWSTLHEREYVEKETPDEPGIEGVMAERVPIRDNNHTVFAWGFRKLMKQPNKVPSSYCVETNQRAKVCPNLNEALYLTNLMPMKISPRVIAFIPW